MISGTLAVSIHSLLVYGEELEVFLFRYLFHAYPLFINNDLNVCATFFCSGIIAAPADLWEHPWCLRK